ncbi:MAG: class I SAM-dependent methyltransferase [Candidatus Hodarchaeota archaeon]
MNPKDKKMYIERYEKNYERYGYDPRTLGWSKGRQEIRFHVLTSIGDVRNKSILDLGCGFADLYDFLVRRGWQGKYTGFDIVPKLVEVARERHPGIDVRLSDILEDDTDEKFDYILASGVFNAKLSGESNELYIKKMMQKMFEMAYIGISVDFMSSYVDYRQEETYHVEPEVVFKMCKKLSKRVILRHDYMPYEFAVYVYKEDSINVKRNIFSQFLREYEGVMNGNK